MVGKTHVPLLGRLSSKALWGINGRLVFLFLAVLTPLLFLQGFTYYEWFQERKATELQNNLEMARAVGKAFHNFVQDVIHLELAIAIAATASPPLSPADLNRILEQNVKDFSGIRAFHWLGPEGRIILSSNPQAIAVDLSDTTFFKEIKAGREWVVADCHISKLTGKPAVTISRGIRNQSGDFLGLVVAAVDPDQLDNVLGIARQQEASISLLDSKGILVYRFPPVQISWEERQRGNIFPSVKEALQGKEVTTIVPATPYESKSRLVANTPIRSIGWVAGAGIREEEAMRSGTSSLLRHGIMLVITALASLLVAMAISRTISHPLKRINDQLSLIGHGELQALTEVRGPTEIMDFAQAFNAMMADLRRTALVLQSISEITPDLIYVKDLESRIIFANPAALHSIGKSAAEVIGQSYAEFHPDPEQAAAIRAFDQEVINSRSTRIFEESCTSPEGLRVYLSTKSPLLDQEGKVVGLVGISRDITARKREEEELQQAYRDLEVRIQERTAELSAMNAALVAEIAESRRMEEMLRQSEDKYRNIIDNSIEGISRSTLDGFFITVNPACALMFGFDSPEQMIREVHNIGEQLYVHSGERLGLLERLDQEGQVLGFEAEMRRRNGDTFWTSLNARCIRGQDGQVIYYDSFLVDITDRKRADEALRSTTQKLQLILDMVPAMIWQKDREERYTLANKAHCQVIGLLERDILGKTTYELFPTETAYQYTRAERVVLESGLPVFDMEEEYTRTSGEQGWCRVDILPYYDVDGHIAGTIGFAVDITEREQAQEVLREQKELYRLLVSDLNDGFFKTDAQGVLTFINDAFVRIHGFDTPDELLGKQILDLVEPTAREMAARLFFTAVASGQAPELVEIPALRKDGSIVQTEVKPTIVFQKDGMVTAQGLLFDITQRKQAEEQIKAALREKEVLLKEIYHRTKNNLQVVCSLLRLQSVRFSDPQLLGAFEDTGNRIRSMALVHEKLYQSKDLSRIDLKDYIKDLTNFFLVNYQTEYGNISLHLDLQSVIINIDTAMPCGLMLNELISNAIKYAFPGGRKGTITILLSSTEDGDIELQVADDGVGLPSELDIWHTDSLGLKLVKNLVNSQLGGKLELRRAPGTEFRIIFREMNYKPRI